MVKDHPVIIAHLDSAAFGLNMEAMPFLDVDCLVKVGNHLTDAIPTMGMPAMFSMSLFGMILFLRVARMTQVEFGSGFALGHESMLESCCHHPHIEWIG